MKKLFIVWLTFTIYLCATSLVQTYRKEGLKALELQIEKMLQSQEYWQKYLDDKDIKKGYYEFNTPIVFVDKIAKTMDLYHNKNYKLSLTSSQEVIVGKMGDKQKEGDLKTPVGVYEIVRRFIPNDSFYGPVSFELSYPNVLDKLDKKNGYGIWIHGFPLNQKKREHLTKGCVAVENDILKKFDKDLGVDKAIVIISEKGDVVATKQDIKILLSSLYVWKNAWKYNNLEYYLSFYDKDFKRFDGKNLKAFSNMKKIIFSRDEKKTIIFQNIAISPYPNLKEKRFYKISFDEFYKSDNYKFTGKKELYVYIKDGKMKIVAEK